MEDQLKLYEKNHGKVKPVEDKPGIGSKMSRVVFIIRIRRIHSDFSDVISGGDPSKAS
jgi:hypothetical protein